MSYWKLKGSTDTAKTVKFVGDFIQHETDLYDLETFVEKFEIGVKPLEEIINDESLYSLEDISTLIRYYDAKWDYNPSTSFELFTTSNDRPSDELESGTEIFGILAGYDFESVDKSVKIRTIDGIKGRIDAIIYVTTDRKYVIFYN